MYNSYRPQKTDSKLDYQLIAKLFDDNKKMANTRYDSNYFRVLEDSCGRYISLSLTSSNAASVMTPWQIYAASDVSGTAAFRTISVHDGTINAVHAVKDVADTYSDDTSTTDKNIVLDASSAYYVNVYQTYSLTDWTIAKTAIFVVKDTGTNSPYVGYPTEHNSIRNVIYYNIGKVTTSDDTLKVLTIDEQLLNTNFLAPIVVPAFWEPINSTTNALTPGATEWRAFKINRAGEVVPTVTITDIATTYTLSVSTTNLFYLKYTLDIDTGVCTAMQLLTTTGALPVATTPTAGHAPAYVCRLLSSVQVPAVAGQSINTMSPTSEELDYQISTVGWDVNTSGAVVNLYAGYFS